MSHATINTRAIRIPIADELIPDLPETGPLTVYRQKASFDWKNLRLYLFQEEGLRFKTLLYNIFENDPVFSRLYEESPSNEKKQQVHYQTLRLSGNNEIREKITDMLQQHIYFNALVEYDLSLAVKLTLGVEFFLMTLRSESNGMEDFIHQVECGKIVGAFAVTEVGHGSNLQALKTTATYDPATQEFVLNSPCFESWKCWIGNLARTAVYANVLAQLYTHDGKCHGLHFFLIPIRDRQTFKTLPGIIIGDVGLKTGNDGIDNGFMAFKNYRIPRTSLLNRRSDVTPDGQFVSDIEDDRKRFAETVSNLNMTRLSTWSIAIIHLIKAVTVAIRYAAIRKQFGPTDDKEVSLIEYQLHQWRLLPYLSACYVVTIGTTTLMRDVGQLQAKRYIRDYGEHEAAYTNEVHLLLCCGKPYVSWIARDGIQESREACGAHGYHKESGFNKLRNDHDANVTWEGDNNVILQRTSIKLLSLLRKKSEGQLIKSITGFFDFINHMDETLKRTCNEEAIDQLTTPEGLMQCHEWLVCFKLRECGEKFATELATGKDLFTSNNDTQVFFSQTLGLLFSEYTWIMSYFMFLKTNPAPPDCAPVLLTLGRYFSLWRLEKNLAILYYGGYFKSIKPTKIIRETLLEMGTQLKDEAIALVDALAPHDVCINSVLGKSDGQAYKHLARALLHHNNAFPATYSPEDFTGNQNTRKNKL